MMIHDFDGFVLMGDMPAKVFATGSVLTAPEIACCSDYDSASAILIWEDGRQFQSQIRDELLMVTTNELKYMDLLEWWQQRTANLSGLK